MNSLCEDLPRKRGFTLIELMVVIGIIGLIIAITLPALARARTSAREVVALANLRTVGITFNHYADQYGTFPLALKGHPLPGMPPDVPPDVLLVPWWPEGTIIGVNEHWALASLWPGLVAFVAPWPENYPTWRSPGLPTELPGMFDFGDAQEGMGISVRYSNSFVARPSLWRGDAEADESLLGAIAPDEVAHPSQKVMLWDGDLAYIPEVLQEIGRHFDAPTPMAFADLHAAALNPTQATDGVPNPLADGRDTKLHNTKSGILGWDY